MAKGNNGERVRRRRPQYTVTLNRALVDKAMKIGQREALPVDGLSRLIDLALSEFIERRRQPRRPLSDGAEFPDPT